MSSRKLIGGASFALPRGQVTTYTRSDPATSSEAKSKNEPQASSPPSERPIPSSSNKHNAVPQGLVAAVICCATNCLPDLHGAGTKDSYGWVVSVCNSLSVYRL